MTGSRAAAVLRAWWPTWSGPGRFRCTAEDPLDVRDRHERVAGKPFTVTKPISVSELNAKDPRVVRQIEAVFKKRKIATRFNHYKPAAVLLREQAAFAPRIDAATVTRADQLFTRLNSLLPKR